MPKFTKRNKSFPKGSFLRSKALYKAIFYFILFFIVIGDSIRYLFKFSLLLLLHWIKSSRYVSLLILKYISGLFRLTLLKLFYLLVGLNNLIFFILKFVLKSLRDATNAITTKIKYFFFGVSFTIVIFLIVQGFVFAKSLPNPSMIGSVNYALSTHIYDRNGSLLYEIYKDQNRTPVKLASLPKYIAESTIAIEDKDFYKHKGISIVSGIIRAIKDMAIQKNLQGGSTITQQLVKTSLLTPERTIQRKIKEVILALWTEKIYTKEQILEMYVNQVPYGGLSYGIEEASRTYFNKHAKDLTLSEAALLAGLPQAPSTYSPYSNPQAAIKRRNDVLKKMRELGYISEKEIAKAQSETLSIIPAKTSIKAPHFVFYVKSQLEDMYGLNQVEEGGLRVTTTLDLDIQNEAEKILREELEKIKHLNVTNGAVLVTRPSTGEILAMVGSVDYFASPYGAYNVTTALRQPGSAIKPIMYSLALEKGFTAASMIDDSPVVFAGNGGDSYAPVNYDGRFHGRVPLRFALANSYNVPAVKALNAVGVDKFVDYARNLGITTWNDSSRFGLSLTLGGGEVKLVDLASAYGVFANGGYRVGLNSVLNLDDVSNLERYNSVPRSRRVRVIDESNAYIISDILSDNFARQWAFGPKSLLEIPGYKAAVKTGTTDNKKDNLTLGYTPEFLVAVWVGNNDGTPMHPELTSGITGAAPIWNRVMSYVLKNYGNSSVWYQKPDGMVEKVCYFGRKEFFIKGTDANVFCGSKSLLESSNPSTKPNTFN